MKKYIIIILIILTASGIYLNRTYAHIYNKIGETDLPDANQFPKNYLVGEKTDEQTIKIAFLGDSLTAGVGVKWLEDTYPYRLAKKISDNKKTQVEVMNLGVPGATSIDVRDQQLPKLDKFQANITLLFIGTNDMHNRVGEDMLDQRIGQIIAKLQNEYTTKKIYVIDIPYLVNPRLFWPPYQFYFENQIYKYNIYGIGEINRWSDVGIIKLSDLTYQQFTDKTQNYYSADLFHPNSEGYKLIADNIYDHLSF